MISMDTMVPFAMGDLILMAAEEKTNGQIAKAVGTTYSTVSIWRNRFYNSIDLIAQTEEYDGLDSEKSCLT